jgi:hypothetical protein
MPEPEIHPDPNFAECDELPCPWDELRTPRARLFAVGDKPRNSGAKFAFFALTRVRHRNDIRSLWTRRIGFVRG